MASLSFPDETLDAIACLFALIHLPVAEQLAIVRSVCRWLRPGGIFLATVGHQARTGLEQKLAWRQGRGHVVESRRRQHIQAMVL